MHCIALVISEVPSFLSLKCMQEWYILGVEMVSCLAREVSSFQGSGIEGFYYISQSEGFY